MKKGDIVNVDFNGIETKGINEEVYDNGILVKIMGYYILFHKNVNGLFTNTLGNK